MRRSLLTTVSSIGTYLYTTMFLLVSVTSAFSGDFLLSNIVVDASASQSVEGVLNHSNYIYFNFADQDTPQFPPVPCLIYWPSTSSVTDDDTTTALCANNTFGVSVLADSSTSSDATTNVASFSPRDFGIELTHTYIDESLGDFPQNILTKFGGLDLTWPGVEGWYCEKGQRCWSRTGTAFLATVTRAIS